MVDLPGEAKSFFDQVQELLGKNFKLLPEAEGHVLFIPDYKRQLTFLSAKVGAHMASSYRILKN